MQRQRNSSPSHDSRNPLHLLAGLRSTLLRRRTSDSTPKPDWHPPYEQLRLLLTSIAVSKGPSPAATGLLQEEKEWPSRRTHRDVCQPKGLTRWALTPSVFQHIGSRSSKWRGKGSDVVDENGLISTERIWNYHFEAWDADRLRNEHRYE